MRATARHARLPPSRSAACEVVVAVGAALARRATWAASIQRPAQRRRPLAGEVPGRAALIGLVDGDVHPGVADRLARGGEPGAVTELGEDRDRGQLPDPVVRHQRLAPGLAARVGAQLLVERRDLRLERVDHRQRDRDLLARGRRQRLRCEPLAPVAGHQLPALRAAVVIQHRLDPLLPLRRAAQTSVWRSLTRARRSRM